MRTTRTWTDTLSQRAIRPSTLTWTETSYGEKTYTKLLNGASIGTETITLTDPNTPSTLKWNFSDKHDGTAEGFSVHDDQTPPCYVEKASDGTWSLTLTGVLANRQDQSPGNNWDYIETTGGTVYLKYKSWDTGGYWSGPYTRAEWSSSIGSETIRIYEHSSYSEQYNNGIYLIQESSSFTNFPSTIAFTGWWKDQFNRHYQLTTSTDTFIQYELYDANGLVGAEYGSTFTSTPSGILFNVEDVGDSSTPFSYSNGSTFVGTSGIVQAGDSLTLWTNATGTGTAEAVFTVPDFFYEAPSLNWWEDGYGALPVITGTGALNGQSFSFYAEDSTHIEFVLSGTESNPSTIKFTKADGSWIDGTSGDWPSQVNYDSTNVILRTNTWSNEFVNPNTSSPYTA